jgi:hypothetical protein
MHDVAVCELVIAGRSSTVATSVNGVLKDSNFEAP